MLTRAHVYDHRKTLYALGKTALLEADVKDAEKSWLKLLSIEKDSDLAAQTHFALAGLYRKQGKVSEAEREMQEFQKLQNVNPSQPATAPHQKLPRENGIRLLAGRTCCSVRFC